MEYICVTDTPSSVNGLAAGERPRLRSTIVDQSEPSLYFGYDGRAKRGNGTVSKTILSPPKEDRTLQLGLQCLAWVPARLSILHPWTLHYRVT